MKNQYLKNDELADSLEEAQDLGLVTERVCRNLRLIAEHLLGDPRFSRYGRETKEDLASHAFFKCVSAIKYFKREYRRCAFSYYTRTCETAYFEYLKKHYRYVNTKRALTQKKLRELEQLNPLAAQAARDAGVGGADHDFG